jgi:hypothetical protein
MSQINQERLRTQPRQIRNFVLFTFCAGLASLFRRIPHLGSVTIDEEYTGKNFVIKKITLQMLEKTKHVPDIRFGRIGKKALAHNRAYAIAATTAFFRARQIAAFCITVSAELVHI